MAAEFLQFVFAGLTVGATYALAALGFAMVYNASGVINFAQGEYIMLGGMGASARASAAIFSAGCVGCRAPRPLQPAKNISKTTARLIVLLCISISRIDVWLLIEAVKNARQLPISALLISQILPSPH